MDEVTNFTQTISILNMAPYWANEALRQFNNNPYKYTKNDVVMFLKDPLRHEKELRQLHQYLFYASTHYKRLIYYFANILTFDYIVLPYEVDLDNIDIKKFKNNFYDVLKYLEKFSIKDEFLRVMRVILGEDVGYYYLRESSDFVTLQRLPSDRCKLITKTPIGYQYAFDLNYFNVLGVDINSYPEELQEAFKKYQDGKTDNWYIPSIEKAVAFKFEDNGTTIPTFIGLFIDLIELFEYKDILKDQSILSASQLLVQRIPMHNDKLVLDYDTSMKFHKTLRDSLPNNVKVVTTPMEVEAFTVNRESALENIVDFAMNNLFKTAGVSQLLFGEKQSSSAGLMQSIIVDVGFVSHCYRQFERWINYQLSKLSGRYKFKLVFPDITIFNRNEKMDKYLKGAEFGYSKFLVASAMGLTPQQFLGTVILDTVFELSDKLIPLQSSHTQTNRGKKEKPIEDLSEAGVKTRDLKSNNEV